VEDEAAVAEEGALALDERAVAVDVGGLEGVLCRVDEAVLAAQVADLAGLWALVVAGNGLAADVGVEMGLGGGAVAILGNRGGVDVVGLGVLV
jgi:hypothetical protein